MSHFPIENSTVFGVHPDGTEAHRWTEGNRVFVEVYEYIKAVSGISYGVTIVKEITQSNA